MGASAQRERVGPGSLGLWDWVEAQGSFPAFPGSQWDPNQTELGVCERKLVSQNSNPPPLLGARRTTSPTTSKASQALHPPACCCPSAQPPPSTPAPCLRPPAASQPGPTPTSASGQVQVESRRLVPRRPPGLLFPEPLLGCPWLGSLALVLARVGLAKCRQDAGFPLAVGIEGPAPTGDTLVHSWRGPGHLCLWLT